MTATTLTNSGLRNYVIKCLNPQCALPAQMDGGPAVVEHSNYRHKGQFIEINGAIIRRDTQAVNVTETRRKPSSKILYSPVYLERETIACIRALPPAKQCWINYCYIDKSFNDDELNACINALQPQLIERLMLKTTGRGKLTAAALTKINNVFMLAAGEARFRLNHSGRPYHSPKQLQMLIGATPRSWRGTWSQRWKVCVSIWLEHDSETLNQIERILDAIEAESLQHECDY